MRPLLPLALSGLLLVAGCATTPPGQDPVQLQLNDLNSRITKVEHVIANRSLLQLAEQVDSLQGQIRDLRGRIDDLQNANQQLRKQQQDLYADLNRRVNALEHGSAAAPRAPSAGSSEQPGVTSTEQQVYGQAFDALKAGSYSVAITGFSGFIKTYPASPLAANAEYWLGEAQYVNQNYAAAERAFRAVLEKFPNSSKAPAAMLDLGNTQLAAGKTRAGKATLEEVVTRFPGTDAATRAQTRLQQFSH
jgi:tol-pal system protein YbgF